MWTYAESAPGRGPIRRLGGLEVWKLGGRPWGPSPHTPGGAREMQEVQEMQEAPLRGDKAATA